MSKSTKNSVDVIDINPTLRARIEVDNDAESPAEWENLGQIAYCSSRETLGTENVSRERMHDISQGIADGSLIGLPVYAYVHSGVTIRTTAFTDPWDSGHSGYVYCTKEKAIAEFGKKILTPKAKEQALKCLKGEVETFDQYLTSDVYGVIVERVIRDEDGDEIDTQELESCWGFFGLDYAREEAKRMGDDQAEQDIEDAAKAKAAADKEAAERLALEERDIMTIGGQP